MLANSFRVKGTSVTSSGGGGGGGDGDSFSERWSAFGLSAAFVEKNVLHSTSMA
jgi:hypothetical protein